jgi:hypothetical protein
VPRGGYRYARRNDWTPEEWIIAYDACPKVKQSYGPEAAFVREVADLLGRTPAAVSRAFGNLWAAQTSGRRGLKHCSHVAEAVVAEYKNDLVRLHEEATRLRSERIPRALTLRVELVSPEDTTPLPEEVVHGAARQSGLRSSLYFVTTRPGSTVVDVGILLDSLLIGTTGWLAITNTVQLVRDYIDRRTGESNVPTIVIKSRNWTSVERGRTSEVEERVLEFYLPGFPPNKLPSESRSKLTGFLAFIKGLRRRRLAKGDLVETIQPPGAAVGRPFKRAALERMLGIDLTSVPDESIKQLSDLVKVAKTTGFVNALRSTRRSVSSRRRST